ncbi:hypothetical protein EVAR_3963_1 [Eumeta japonica]|uniref:Dystrophin n=1 Tax=Eumeta variegata TaxID=151549 RepID=A0A4C1STI3_EUMVA|nr:hypothetical protein EVAR_3963_1 [Eumeta japonica]
MISKEVELKKTVNTRPIVKQDDFKDLESKITAIESVLLAEHAMFNSENVMREKVDSLKKIDRDMNELQSSYDSVVKQKQDKYGKNLSDQAMRFRNSLDTLVMKFSDTKAILDQKLGRLEKGIELLNKLKRDITELNDWLIEVDRFLKENRVIPVGDTQLLEKLLDISNKYDEQKSTYKEKLNDIETAKETVLEDCDEVLAKEIKSETKDFRKKFTESTESSFKFNENLRRALEKTEMVFRKIEETEKWLTDIENQIPKEEECKISDSTELYQMKMRFQTLKDKCDDRTQEFRNLNETGNDIMLKVEDKPPTSLTKRFTHLNARWTQVTNGVYERYKVLQEAWHETGELRAWLAQETAWLDGLQRRLRKSPNSVADAEEISDELYDLENYIQNHSDERLSRIQDVGRQLIDAHIMPGWMQAEIDTVTDRWNNLRREAAARTKLLESSAKEATKSEVSIDNLSQWLSDVNCLLANRLDQDLTASDLPEDHQRLVEEFECQRGVLKEVEDQIAAYQAAGKNEAAARLKDQLEHVKQHFATAESRLTAFGGGSPAVRLAARLARATDTLRGVQRGAACLLELAGADPDAVRAQLRHCLRFYRTLSEIKSEVESIIKTGRKMVEDKSVPEPHEFSKKIDNLKELYNKLGAQITESKTKLENALITAREIQNDLHTLNDWLDGLGTNIGKQTLELEMSRMEAIKDKLNANHAEFQKHCDPVYLENLKEQIDATNKRWDHLKRHGFVRRESDIEILQKYLNDIESEVENLDKISIDRLKDIEKEVRGKAAEVETLDNKALTKQWEKVLDKITESRKKLKDSVNINVVVEYEKLTDTIKRRLESPVNSPDSEKPAELKKSKIPLALRSPVPIRKEIKEGGSRSRNSSLERNKRKASDSSLVTESTQSIFYESFKEPSSRQKNSAPSTPETPRNSSTFNLLKDSELFSQISDDKLKPNVPSRQNKKIKHDTCHVVEVKEHEIIKSTVSPIEPIEIYPTETVETIVQLQPQTVETVEILDDTETESICESDVDEPPNVVDEQSYRTTLSNIEPNTFVVEVKRLNERMEPTLGVLQKKDVRNENKLEAGNMNLDNVPDLVQRMETKTNRQDSTCTPPPTPCLEEFQFECPLLYDLAVREKQKSKPNDEINEYLILDDVPKDQADLPEQSVTEVVFANESRLLEGKIQQIEDAVDKPTEKPITNMPEISRNISVDSWTEEEVVYAEIDDKQIQLRSSTTTEFDDKHPLSTSTPIKLEQEMKTKNQVQVVAMSPKLSQHSDSSKESNTSEDSQKSRQEDVKSKKLPSPLPKSAKTSETQRSPTSPLLGTKSHIPVSRERLKNTFHSDKYQKTDDSIKVPSSPKDIKVPSSPKLLDSPLRTRFGSECDDELLQFEEEANQMSRRMDVMLVTVGGVNMERDPGKRLEILKNQLGALAPDAAALISKGDSLVYAKHKKNPLLADYIQTHYQDKLRNKWSMVMSEIESKRNLAIKAEDNLKELSKLIESLHKWLKEVENEIKSTSRDSQGEGLKSKFHDREQDIEQMNELCRDLKTQHIGYPEKSVSDINAAWVKACELYETVTTPKGKEKKIKSPDAIELKGSEYVTKVNRIRESVSVISRMLNSAPLNGKDYDEFPLQEDALSKVKSLVSELQPTVDEIDKEYGTLVKKCKKEQSEQIKRVHDKLKEEWISINKGYKERHDKWSKCQAVWANLYSMLEEFGEWLDGADRTLEEISRQNIPFKDVKQKMKDLEKQVSNRQRQMSQVSAVSRDVVSQCSMPLSRDVSEQLDILRERWLHTTARVVQTKDRIIGQENLNLMKEGAAAWYQNTRACLGQVNELLDTTSPNPSDDTSLSIRLSLVKIRPGAMPTPSWTYIVILFSPAHTVTVSLSPITSVDAMSMELTVGIIDI